MKKVYALTAAIVLLCLGALAQADVFNLGTGFTNLETVAVGNPGNGGQLSGHYWLGYDYSRICGSVNYTYNIGKYEITAKQYTDFLNNKAKTDTYGLYSSSMADTATEYVWGCNIQRTGNPGSYTYTVADDWANRPVNHVSLLDACRFANWLHNGQGNGDTETGAYTLTPGGTTITRNGGWKWAVTSEDEWYKAAYYKGGGTTAGYWQFPTSSYDVPDNVGWDGYSDPGNHANYSSYFTYTIGSPYYRTNVGEFENSASAYGTFDQGGNVQEWTETIIFDGYFECVVRGGSYMDDWGMQEATGRAISWVGYDYPFDHESAAGNRATGFRVSGVPEPVYGISNRDACHPIISTASANFNFKVWGKVTNLVTGSSFTVDDGSGSSVNVIAPGFGGILDGDYASAKGKFSGEGSNRVLNAQASDVVKLR